MHAYFGQRHLRGAGFAEQSQHVVPDVVQQCLREYAEDTVDVTMLPCAVNRNAAGRQLLDCGASGKAVKFFLRVP